MLLNWKEFLLRISSLPSVINFLLNLGCNVSRYLSIENEMDCFPNSWGILLYKFVTSNVTLSESESIFLGIKLKKWMLSLINILSCLGMVFAKRQLVCWVRLWVNSKVEVTGLNAKFSFSKTCCHDKVYLLFTHKKRIVRFILFSRLLALLEMQTASSWILTRVGVSVSSNGSHYSTSTLYTVFYTRFFWGGFFVKWHINLCRLFMPKPFSKNSSGTI